MSETTSRPAGADGITGVDLSKPAAGARPTATPQGVAPRRGLFGGGGTATQIVPVPVPRSIRIALAGLALAIVGAVLQAIGFRTSDSWLTEQFTKSYNDADPKPSQPLAGYISDGLHRYHLTWIQLALISLILLLLGYSICRTRSASASRWALLVVFVLTQMPFQVVPGRGVPLLLQAGFVAGGVGSIVAIIFVFFVPQSQRYFRECRAAVNPAAAGVPRPSLATLFSPRRAAQQATAGATSGSTQAAGRSGGATAVTEAAGSATGANGATGASRAKAKVRADADAVAKGAELARSRAKTGKNRR